MNILLYGWFGEENIGDELILDSSIDLIRKYLSKARINIMGTKPDVVKRLHCNLDPDTCISTYIDYRPKEILRAFKYSFIKVLNNILNNDMLIISSGGALSDWHKVSTITLFFMVDLYYFLKKPIYMLGVGAGPINVNRSYSRFYKRLDRINIITVRDQSSYNELFKFDLSNLYKSRDVVYSYADKIKRSVLNVKEANKSVGLVLASVCYETKCVHDEYIKQINMLMREMIKKGYKVRIIPFLYNEDKSFLDKLTIPAEVEILADVSNPYAAIRYIAGCEIVVGIRYHALVLAAILNKKIIPLVHHSKNGDFVRDYSLEAYAEYIGDGNNWNNSQISAGRIIDKIEKIEIDNNYYLKLKENVERKYAEVKAEEILFNAILKDKEKFR